MRIVAGRFKGRPIAAPKGDGTRPTTDRVREALMSSLGSQMGGFSGLHVLDAFGGSGALSIEALSRGAEYALIYERDRKSAQVIERNRKELGIGKDDLEVRIADICKRPPIATGKLFDLLFLDPPYAYGAQDIAALVKGLDEAGVLADAAILAYEHAKTTSAVAEKAFGDIQWEAIVHKTYGDTAILIARKGTE